MLKDLFCTNLYQQVSGHWVESGLCSVFINVVLHIDYVAPDILLHIHVQYLELWQYMLSSRQLLLHHEHPTG